MRALLPLMKVVRVLIAIQAVGGVVGVVVGAVTLNGGLVIGGLGQLVLAGLVLGLSFGSEQVVEAKGAAGSFVIRTGPHRRWRDERGLARVVPFVMGHRTWRASVRGRADDPFGAVVATAEAASERDAIDVAHEIAARIQAGEAPSMVDT